MRILRVVPIIAAVIMFVTFSALGQSEYESSGTLDVLYGENFEPNEVDIFTLTPKHNMKAGAYEHYGFVDLFYETTGEVLTAHMEFYPKISLSRIGNNTIAGDILEDVLIGGGINADFGGGSESWAWLFGPVWKFAVPGFDSFQLETYYYRQTAPEEGDYSGTYQITPSWNAYLPVNEDLEFRFTGFVDFIGDGGAGTHQIVSHPQLLLDLGSFWNNPRQVYAGTEWRYWHNKGGVEGVTESVFQLALKFEM